jgi:hypothetical protein
MSIITDFSPRKFYWPERSRSWIWRDIVCHALKSLGGTAPLRDLYAVIERHPRTKARKNWRPKVRQTLELSPLFVRVGDGTWSLAAGYSQRQVARFVRRRRERWPLRARDGADQ